MIKCEHCLNLIPGVDDDGFDGFCQVCGNPLTPDMFDDMDDDLIYEDPGFEEEFYGEGGEGIYDPLYEDEEDDI